MRRSGIPAAGQPLTNSGQGAPAPAPAPANGMRRPAPRGPALARLPLRIGVALAFGVGTPVLQWLTYASVGLPLEFSSLLFFGILPATVVFNFTSGAELSSWEAHYCGVCARTTTAVWLCPDCRLPCHTAERYALETMLRPCRTCRPVLLRTEDRARRGLLPACSGCHRDQRMLTPVLPVIRIGVLTEACRNRLMATGEEVRRKCREVSVGPISDAAVALVVSETAALGVVDLSAAARPSAEEPKMYRPPKPLHALWISAEADPLQAAQALDRIARLPRLEGYLARSPLYVEAEELPAAISSRLRRQLATPHCGISWKAALPPSPWRRKP